MVAWVTVMKLVTAKLMRLDDEEDVGQGGMVHAWTITLMDNGKWYLP